MTDILWDLVSEYVRRTAADQYGRVRCFTCGRVMRWQDAQCGHGLGRYHGATRYHLKNLAVQCPDCNCGEYGKQDVFARKTDELYGAGTWEELERLSRTVNKLSKSDRQELIDEYKMKLKSLNRKAA